MSTSRKHTKRDKGFAISKQLRQFVKLDKRIDKALKKILIGKEMNLNTSYEEGVYQVQKVRALVKGTRAIADEQVLVTAVVIGEVTKEHEHDPNTAPLVMGDRRFVVPLEELVAALETEKEVKPKKKSKNKKQGSKTKK